MAATEITAQEIIRTGTGKVVALAAANVDGNYYTNGSLRSLRISNGGAGAITLTVDIPIVLDGVAAADKTYSIPNDSNVHELAPFPSSVYGGVVNLSYSGVTSLTVAVTYYKEENN
jgi:hypothetical protein